jgi:hypothetical protein
MIGIGLSTPNYPKFSVVFQGLLPRLSPYHWPIDGQSGPFSITGKPDYELLQAELKNFLVHVTSLEDTSTHLWKPRILPRFADPLVVDEGTWLIGLPADKKEALRVLADIEESEWLSQIFFELIERNSVVFCLHVDGWWEIYTCDPGWTDSLKEAPGIFTVDSSKWLDEVR